MANRSETNEAHEKICEVTAEYFFTHKKEVFFSLSTQDVYEEVKKNQYGQYLMDVLDGKYLE